MGILKYPISLLVAFTTLCSCGGFGDSEKQSDASLRVLLNRRDSLALKVAVMPTLDCLPLYLATDSKLFDTLHVDVRLYRYHAQMDCDTALLRKWVEGSVTDKVRAARMMRRGLDLQCLTETNAYWQLYSNRKARLKKLNQLGDKMVAMTRYSVTDYLTDALLDTVRNKAQVFRVQINDVNLRLKMLLNNEMDALWLPEPQATAARLHGNVLLADSRDCKEDFGIVVFRRYAMTDGHRQQQMRAFVRAYNTACDSLNQYGVKHYVGIVKKYCEVDDRTISALPKLTFKKVKTVQLVDKYKNKY